MTDLSFPHNGAVRLRDYKPSGAKLLGARRYVNARAAMELAQPLPGLGHPVHTPPDRILIWQLAGDQGIFGFEPTMSPTITFRAIPAVDGGLVTPLGWHLDDFSPEYNAINEKPLRVVAGPHFTPAELKVVPLPKPEVQRVVEPRARQEVISRKHATRYPLALSVTSAISMVGVIAGLGLAFTSSSPLLTAVFPISLLALGVCGNLASQKTTGAADVGS